MGAIQCGCDYMCHANAQLYWPTYRCPATTGGKIKPHCDIHFSRYADVVDRKVWRAITEILLDENNLRQAVLAQRAQAQSSVQPLADRLEALQHAWLKTWSASCRPSSTCSWMARCRGRL